MVALGATCRLVLCCSQRVACLLGVREGFREVNECSPYVWESFPGLMRCSAKFAKAFQDLCSPFPNISRAVNKAVKAFVVVVKAFADLSGPFLTRSDALNLFVRVFPDARSPLPAI